MRPLLSALTLLVALTLLAPATGAFAPKPPNFTAASVVFRDAPDDRIRSDGRGMYADTGQRGSQQGAEVRMWINGSQDLTIGTFQSGRTLQFTYAPAADVAQPTANPPAGALVDNSFVNVRNIADMGIGETKITRASFNTAVGYFRWLGAPNPGTNSTTEPSYGSWAVQVTRTSGTTWDVQTPAPTQSFPQIGTPPADFIAGDLTVLLRDAPRNTLTPVGLYHMAFGLTVTCPGCQ